MDRAETLRSRPSGKKSMSDRYNSKKCYTGHVLLDKPNVDLDDMDMKVHLTLKSKKKPRSSSLSAADRRRMEEPLGEPSRGTYHVQGQGFGHEDRSRHYREQHGKRWSEILRTGDDVPPPPYRSHPRSATPDSVIHHDTKRSSQGQGHMTTSSFYPRGSSLEGLNSFALFHPVSALEFLMNELQRIIKNDGDRPHQILSLAKTILDKLPRESPVCQGQCNAAKSHVEATVTTPKSSNQCSRTAFEKMRKEKDSLQKQLDEKSKSHLSLERRNATLEAKLVRCKSDRDDLRGVLEKMTAEQRSLIAALNSKNQGLPLQLEEIERRELELKAARTYISKMQEANAQLENMYRNKMKEVQDILHGIFDYSKNDSICVNEALGPPPPLELNLESLADLSLTTSTNLPTAKLPESPATFSNQNVETGKQDGQCLGNMFSVGQDNNDQQNMFQSFISLPECS